MGLAVAVSKIFDLIFLILVITILLSWFPRINWYNEPFKSMRAFSEIFLGPFRRLIPPIGMVDISPIIAFFALEILRRILVGLLISLGL